MRVKCLWLGIFLVGVASLGARLGFGADPFSEKEGNPVLEHVGTAGTIDWLKGTIEAAGIGAPPHEYEKSQARRLAFPEALADAYESLLETVLKVRIDSSTTVEGLVFKEQAFLTQIESMVRKAQDNVATREYLSDGTVKVVLCMSMRGGLSQLILPDEIVQVQDVKQMGKAKGSGSPRSDSGNDPEGGSKRGEEKDASASRSEPPNHSNSGVVVDARGIGAKPALAPKILDEEGRQVYGSAFVSREFAVQQGMTGYVADLSSAQKNTRVGGKPLVVRGLRAVGPQSADIVISNADADKVRRTSQHLSLLKRCRVVIVIDQPSQEGAGDRKAG